MWQSGETVRYVAIGDSQTEGLNDYADDGSLLGWADRFAAQLASREAAVEYANLAVRGRRTAEIRREQLAAARALQPNLVTVVSGVNDVVRRRFELDPVVSDIEAMFAALRADDCTVMTCTFPLPAIGFAQRLAPRLSELNAAVRETAARHDVIVVEIEGIPMGSDLRLWSADRVHLNSRGHQRLAAAFFATLTASPDRSWMDPLPEQPQPSALRRAAAETAWAGRFLVPKIVRMVRGRSSGDGRVAKRPALEPIRPCSDQAGMNVA